jgi:hypothetical protein
MGHPANLRRSHRIRRFEPTQQPLSARYGHAEHLTNHTTVKLRLVSSTLAGGFGIAALFVAVLALVFAVQALRGQSGAAKDAAKAPVTPPKTELPPRPQPKPGTIGAELHTLGQQLAATQAGLKLSLQHLAIVRYDAFGDMGGRMSWSVALLDDNGDGVVLTSINSRNDARSYAKEIKAFESEAKLSPEEEEALETLRKQAAAPATPEQD